jgi:hypothetical protein
MNSAFRMQRSAFAGLLALGLAAAIVGCSSGTKVTRVDAGLVTDLSGRWNDTDSRLVAEALVREAVSSQWLQDATQAKGRQPVVVVGTIVNRSHEHINVQTFVTDLSRELTNSQKVIFVAGKSEREELRQERLEQAVHAREDTQKAPGKEIGADYMLKGHISTILDETDGAKAIFYQVDLEMIDLENNVKTWFGQKKIKKVVERKRMMF